MKLRRRQFLQLTAGAVLPLFVSRFASAQAYPSRPVRVVVPYPPGGPTDVFARVIAEKLSEQLGKPFVIENIAGAGGNIGTGQAAKAPADGHTILVAVNSLVINPTLYASVPFDPYKDFDPVTLAIAFGTGLVVNPAVPANSITELVTLVRQNPGKFTYTSGGVGTPSHLLGELFRMSQSLDLPHVPFAGSGPAIGAVVGGHVPLAFTALTPALPHITTGKLRALAITSKRKSTALPSVPTAAELGFPELDGDGWIGVLVPARAPAEVVQTLNRQIKIALAAPDVQQRMATLGFDAIGSSPDAFSAQMKGELEKWAKVIRGASLKPE
jgi:tripartite-type tricarboxylate transporter receptor subunit TctC